MIKFIIKDSISFKCDWFRLIKLDVFTQSLIGESKKLVEKDLDIPWKSDNSPGLDPTIAAVFCIELELDEPTFELLKKKASIEGTKSSKISQLSVIGRRTELIFHNAILDYMNYLKVGNMYKCRIIIDSFEVITE